VKTVLLVECSECGRQSTASERGWHAYVVDDPDDDEAPPELVVYCPVCAEREVG
jgi:hypothetical protein